MPNIDERVVQMKFDNKQFESGVSESLKTLDDLKKALNFDEVEGSLKNIENAFNNLNLSGLADSVDFIASRFEPLGKIADKALDAIANKVVDVGKKITDSFFGFSDMGAGQEKYATRTKAVQTIVNATGKSVEDVEKVLADLQDYTDETSYDFAEMVNSIGKFTSVGIELERAEKAMEGIASEAAKSGAGKAEANRAMYNFAQALSQGAVKLQDWKSIENANMATKEFKETLIQTAIELGVLEDRGDGVGSIVSTNEEKLKKAEAALAKAQTATKDRDSKIAAAQERIAAATKETTVNYQNFNTTLSDGWLTSDVLIATLEKYADRGTDFGKAAYYAAQKALTWRDAVDAVKDAVSSGWMESYQYIFGGLDEAIELWTNVSEALIDFTDIFTSWRNNVLKGWKELDGYNNMIEAATNLWETFMNIVKGVGEALSTVFPILKAENMSNFLADGTKKLKDWSAGLLEMFGIYQEVEEEEEEIAEAVDDIKESIDEVTESTEEASGSMSDLGDAAGKVASSVSDIETGLKKGVRGSNVKELQDKLLSLGFRLDKYGADGIFGPETEKAVKELQQALGVEVTGVFDEATQAALNTEEGMRKLQERAHQGLGLKDVGKDVKDLQNELNKYLGDNDQLVADGVYGPKTEAAVKELQKQLGVEQTGIWDSATETAYKNNKMLLMSIKNMSKQLKEGMKGDAVKKFQEELIKGGYLDASMADGIYGPKTKEAVKALQKELGVTETGVWDVDTWHAFHEAQHTKKAVDELTDSNEKAAESAKKIGEENESASAKSEKSVKHTSIVMMRLQNISKGFSAALKIVSKFAASAVEIFGNITGLFKPLVETFYRFGSYIGNMFENLAADLDKNDVYGSFVKKVTDAFGPFGKFIQNVADELNTFLNTYDTFLESTGKRNTFGNFFDFLKEYLKKSSVVKFIIDAYSTLKAIVGPIITFLVGETKKLIGWFGSDGFKNSKDSVFSWVFDKVGKLREAIAKFRQDHPELTIENFLNKIKEIGGWVGGKFGSGIDILKNKFAEFKAFIDKFIEAHPELSLSNILGKIQAAFKGVGDMFSKFFASGQQSQSGTFFDELKERFKAFEPVIDWLEGIKDKIVKLWQSIFGGAEEAQTKSGDTAKSTLTSDAPMIKSMEVVEEKLSVFERVVNWFIGVKDKLVSAWNDLLGINKGEGVEVPKAGGFVSVADKLKDFAQFIVDNWASIALGVTGISFAYGLVSVIKVAKNLSSGFKDFGGALKSLLGQEEEKDTIGTTALKIAGSLLMVAAAIGLLSLIDADKAWKGIVPFLVVLGAMTTAIILINKLGGKDNDGAKQALMLAGSIGIIALSIWLLCKTISKYSIGVILGALGIVTVMAVVLGVIAVQLLKQESDGVELKGFLSMCAGVLVLVLAFGKMVKIINKNIKNPVNLIAAFAVIEILLVTLGVIAMKISKSNVTGESALSGYFSLCSGVLVLGIAFERMIKILKKNINNPGTVIIAFAIIEIMLLTLGKIAKSISLGGVLGTSSADGYLSLCTGVVVLVEAFNRLINVIKKNANSPGAIIGAFVILELMLLTLGSIGKNMAMSGLSGLKGSFGLLAITVALLVIVESFRKMVDIVSKNKFSNVAAAFGGILILMIMIGQIGKHVGQSMKSIKSIVAFLIIGGTIAGLMYVFANALDKTRGIDAKSMLAFTTALSEVFLAFGVVGAIAGGIGAGTTFLGIIAIAGGIVAVIAALSGILSIPGVEEFLSGGMEKIGKLIGNLIGSIKAAEFESFNKAMSTLQSVSQVDQSKVDNATKAAQAIADFGAGLPEKSIINKVVDRIFGSELWQFSNDMIMFGKGLNGFATQILSIENYSSEELTSRTGVAVSIAESINAFSKQLPQKSAINKIVDRIFGSELKQFSGDMATFGEKFNSYAAQMLSIENYSTEKIAERTLCAIAVAESINTFSKQLPQKSAINKIVDRIAGSELKQFSGDMATFGEKFNSYAAQMLSIENYSTEKIAERTLCAIAVAESINTFSKQLPQKSAINKIVDRIFGSELKQFSGDMATFGEKFNSYAAQMMSITNYSSEELTSRTGVAVSIAESINAFSKQIPTKTAINKIVDRIAGSELWQFSNDMATFGEKFNSYAAQMMSITNYSSEELTSRTGVAVAIAESIQTFSDGLKDKTIPEQFVDKFFGSELNQFSEDMATFASKFNDYSNSMNAILADSKTVESKTNSAVTIAGKIAEFLDKLSGMNIETKHKDILGWFAKDTKGETVFDSINKLAQSISGSQSAFFGIASSNLVADVDAAVTVATSIAGMLSYLGSGDVYSNINQGALGLDALSQMFNDNEFSLATIVKDFANQLEGIENLEDVSNILRGIGTLAGNIMSDKTVTDSFSNSGKSIGSYLINGIATEIQSNDSKQLVSASVVEIASMSVSVFKALLYQYEYIGRMMCLGIAEGLSKKENAVTKMAEEVALKAYIAAKKALEIASPSKKFTWIGEMTGEGLVNGITNYSDAVANAASNMSNEAVSNAERSAMALKDVIGFSDIDDQPVIRPVVDLTNVRNASNEMATLQNTAFGRTSVSTIIAKRISSDIDASKKHASHNTGPTSLGSGRLLYETGNGSSNNSTRGVASSGSLEDLGLKFDKLSEAVTNMKIVLDTGEFVGATSTAYDRQFGRMTGRRERGN